MNRPTVYDRTGGLSRQERARRSGAPATHMSTQETPIMSDSFARVMPARFDLIGGSR